MLTLNEATAEQIAAMNTTMKETIPEEWKELADSTLSSYKNVALKIRELSIELNVPDLFTSHPMFRIVSSGRGTQLLTQPRQIGKAVFAYYRTIGAVSTLAKPATVLATTPASSIQQLSEEISNTVVKVMKQWKSDAVVKLESEIKSVSYNLSDYLNHMNASMQKIATLEQRKMELLKDGENGAEKTALLRELSLIADEGVWSIDKFEDGHIYFSTINDVILRGMGHTINVGKWSLRIKLDNSQVQVLAPPERLYRRIGTQLYHNHPYQDAYNGWGNFCTGGSSNLIAAALGARKYSEVLRLFQQLLSYYNKDSQPYTNIANYITSDIAFKVYKGIIKQGDIDEYISSTHPNLDKAWAIKEIEYKLRDVSDPSSDNDRDD